MNKINKYDLKIGDVVVIANFEKILMNGVLTIKEKYL